MAGISNVVLFCLLLGVLSNSSIRLVECWSPNAGNKLGRHGFFLGTLRAASSASEHDGIPSLYKEQERMLIERGKVELLLMKDTSTPLEAHLVKGAGSGGGFGGVSGKQGRSSSSSSKQQLKEQAKSYSNVLKQDGVVRIDRILSSDTADELRKLMYDMRLESETLLRQGQIVPNDRFADVLLRENRCDMPIPLNLVESSSPSTAATTTTTTTTATTTPSIIIQALDQALRKSPVGLVLANLLGDDAILYEFSCMMSDPGSQRQVVHPDTPQHGNNEPVLYTCFIALQDITLHMGPTTWLPKTHTPEMHEVFQDDATVPNTLTLEGERDAPATTWESRKDRLLRTQPSVLGLLPKGSCGIYDSRLLHCGGANQSETSRALFYFSFKNPKIGYPGNPPSIRPELAGKWALCDLWKILPQQLAKQNS